MNTFFKNIKTQFARMGRLFKGKSLKKVVAENFGRFAQWFEPYSIFTKRTNHTLATNETIFSAVSRLSNSLASLPLKLLDKNFNHITDHPIADLLANSPNPNMNSFEFLRTMETLRNTDGNAYALKDYDMRYQVKALWILDPSKVKEVIEATTKELWYEIQGDKGTYYVHNMDMIHVKHIHGYGYRGISPIDVLRNTIDFERKIKQFSLDLMDSAVKASFILQMASSVNEEKKKEIYKNFRDFYSENGGVLIQELGTTITPIKREFIDTKIFEAEKITRTRVATVYNMPAHMLGETEGVNYSSMEQMSLEFVQGTLGVNVIQYEKEFNRKLLTAEDRRKGLYWKFNLKALLRGDVKSQAEYYFKGVRSMWLTPNEIRALEDLPPMKDGDKLYKSKDIEPIDAPPQLPKGAKGS
jgi:HK97 family phage portal protein